MIDAWVAGTRLATNASVSSTSASGACSPIIRWKAASERQPARVRSVSSIDDRAY